MDKKQIKNKVGRPQLPADQRKECISVRLPQPLLERLRAEESPAKTIASALQGYFMGKEDGNV